MKKIALLFLLAFLIGSVTQGQVINKNKNEKESDFLIKGLKKGRYNVGFSSSWLLDTSREYQLIIDSVTLVPKQARPVLYNIWYPTAETGKGPMKYADYLNIKTTNPEFAAFSTVLYDFNFGVIVKELFKKTYAELNHDESARFQDFMNENTFSIRDAPFITDQKWPLVIYHSGGASSYEDNSVLCEFLASNGFVVVGSAFQNPNGSTFNSDGGEGSFKDFGFLIEASKKKEFIDVNQLTLIGHSFGAQTIIAYQATGRSHAQTIVLLDATFESHSIYFDHLWPSLPELVKKKNEFHNRLLGISSAGSTFQLYENYQAAHRFYLSVDVLTHNEFISQGVLRKRLFNGSDNVGKPDYALVSAKYIIVNETILSVLSGKEAGVRFSDNSGVIFENVKAGKKNNYDPKEGKAPSPRQHFNYYKKYGSTAALSLLKKIKASGKKTPLFSNDYGFAWVYDLLESGNQVAAKKVIAFYQSFQTNEADVMKVFQNWVKFGKIFGEKLLLEDLEEKIKILKK